MSSSAPEFRPLARNVPVTEDELTAELQMDVGSRRRWSGSLACTPPVRPRGRTGSSWATARASTGRPQVKT